jgi:anti-sigma-K factor RskA
MKYDDPRLRDALAGAYVMATLKPRARARFERLMAADPDLAALVANWQARLAPIDATARPEAPPAHVFAEVARRTGIAPPARRTTQSGPGWWEGFAFWRGLALAATAVAAALVLYVAVPREAPPLAVRAVLADQAGAPSWLAVARPDGRVEIAAVGALPLAADRAFELWAIAGGPPRSLGLLPRETGRGLIVLASAVPEGGALAVSLEPAGGSPTGAPTGPVLYQGKVLPAPR